MTIIYISFIILVILILALTFTIISKDTYQNYKIRINEAEANIEATLNKRFDLLNKSNDIIKEELEREDDALSTITNIRSQKLNNFELDKKLYDAIKEFHDYSEMEVNLLENDNYTKIEIDLIESEAEIEALKKYYNDIVSEYNKVIEKFPFSIKNIEEKELFELEDHSKLINSLKEQI